MLLRPGPIPMGGWASEIERDGFGTIVSTEQGSHPEPARLEP